MTTGLTGGMITIVPAIVVTAVKLYLHWEQMSIAQGEGPTIAMITKLKPPTA